MSSTSAKTWLIGAGQMAQDYFKVLQALGSEPLTVGRSAKSVEAFRAATGREAFSGGLEKFLATKPAPAPHAIVSVSREELSTASCQLLRAGVKALLIEKPAGLSLKEVHAIRDAAREHGAKAVIGFNRRFYSSVIEARRLIAADGGIKSFTFDFTEWSHKLEPLVAIKGEKVMRTWFLGNSVHVADLAFYLGGFPKSLEARTSGGLAWHPSSSVFAGSGLSRAGALFSYQANWNAPGRWGIELMTENHKLILRPLEELQVMKKGSVAIEKLPIDDSLDKQFKPGLYLQTKKFLDGNLGDFESIENYCAVFPEYLRIAGYT